MINFYPTISFAISSLRPGAEYTIINEDYEQLTWLDATQSKPSKEEVQSEYDRLVAKYEADEYARNRQSAYPPVGDQLDALFKAGVFPEEMSAKIQAVKDRFPKS